MGEQVRIQLSTALWRDSAWPGEIHHFESLGSTNAWMKDAGGSGTTIWFTWGGRDRRLQTHTAGLRSFDVQYRIDDGPWRLIRDDTTATSIKMGSRPHGHRYWIRVQSADRRGNLSAWTTATSVWVP